MLIRDVLADLDRAPVMSLDDLAGAGAIVILAPHADDETLGCGGLIAAASAQGRRVEIVFLTDGAASHPGSRTHPPQRLALIRQDEARRAAEVLGVPAGQVTFLGQPDAAAPHDGPAFRHAADTVAAIAAAAGATALFVTWEHDPHCDHEAAALVAAEAARRRPQLRVWRYPIWGLHRPADDPVDQRPFRGARLAVAGWLDRKQQALACHASQLGQVIDDDPEGFQLTDSMIAPFLGPYERFIGEGA